MIIDKGNLTVDRIASIVQLNDRKVLEVGCGDGRLSSQLHLLSGEFTAIDPDRQALDMARERYPWVNFNSGSGDSVRSLGQCFDVILFTLSLHHQDGPKALTAAREVLEPAGKVVVIEPAIDSEVSVVCNVFNDETVELQKAVRAIGGSGFRCDLSDILDTEWEFIDSKELMSWLFEFYQHPYERTKVAEVENLLGKKSSDTPLVLVDKLKFSRLSRNRNEE